MDKSQKRRWWNFFIFGWLAGDKITELENKLDAISDQGNFDECYKQLEIAFPLTPANCQNNLAKAKSLLESLNEMLKDTTQNLKPLDRHATLAYSRKLASLIEGVSK